MRLPIFPALLAAAALVSFSGLAAAQSPLPGVGSPQRECQTVRTCRFERGGSYRGCLSSYTCRVCRTVKSRCDISGQAQNCQRLVCTWGG